MNANSDTPNEPGVEVGEEEERDASSVLDKPAVTRPIGLWMRPKGWKYFAKTTFNPTYNIIS